MPIIGSASVQIRAVDKFFERDVRAAVRKVKNVGIELKADVDLTKVNKKLADLRYRLRNNIIKINIEADTDTVQKDFQHIVDTFHNRSVTIQANADTLRAETQLALAARNRTSTVKTKIDPATAKALQGLFYTITGSLPMDKIKASLLGLAGNFESIVIKGTAVISVISALSSSLISLAGSAFTIGQDLVDVIGISAALPAGIFMFGTAVAAATIGWKGFADAVSGKGKKGAEALAGLPVEAQEAAIAMRGLGKEISTPVKKAFWVELGDSLQTLMKETVPALKTGLTDTATAMGGLTKDGFQSIEKFVRSGGLSTMFDGSNQGLQNMRKGLDPVVTAFGKLGVVGSKLLPQFGDWIGKLGEKFGAFIDQSSEAKITGWITDGVNTLQLLGSSLGSISGILSGISAAANEAGFGGLKSFSDGLAGAAAVVNQEPFKSQLVTLFEAAGDASKTLNTSVGNLLKTLGGASQVLGGFFQQGSGVIAAFIDNVTAMLEHSDILSGLYTAVSGLKTAMQQMEPGFIHLGDIIGKIGEIAAVVFQAMAPGFNDIMDTLDQIFTNLAPGLEAVIPIFNSFVQNVIGLASGPIIVLADAIGNILTFFAGLPGPMQIVVIAFATILLLGPKLTAMFTGISDGFSTMRQRMDGDHTGLSVGAARTVTQFSQMRDHFRNAGTALSMIPFAAATSGLGGIRDAAGAAMGSAARGGMRGMAGAASGLMGLMGGPWGIALAGATALLGMYGQAQEESKQKTDALSQTLDQQTGHITNATKSLLANNALDGVTSGWDDFFRGAMQNAKSTEETLKQLGTTTKEYTDKLADSGTRDSYVKGLETIRNAMRDGIPVTDEMARAVGSTKEALAGLSDDDISHLAEKAKNAADELTKAEEKVRKLAAATGLTNAAATIFSKNLETLGSATSSASDKFNALKSNLEALNGGMSTITNTKKGLQQSLADTKKGLEGIADGGNVALNSLYSIKDGFDFSSQAGRDLHTQLESSTDAILKNGTAAMDQAIKGGKSAADANSIAIQAMQPGVAALRSQLASLGVEQPKIDDIIRSFGLMPDQITSAVSVTGTEEAARKIFLTKLAADAFANGNYNSVLGALPESAKKAIADATGTAEAFKNGDYDAVLAALDKTAGGKEAALASILSVTNGNYEAALRSLNLTGPEVDAARGKIDTVVGKTVGVYAADHVSDPVSIMQQNINNMKGKTIDILTIFRTQGTPGAPAPAYNSGQGALAPQGADGAILKSVLGRASLLSGAFPMKAFANGGFEKHTAQFAKAGAMRLWAEPETGGEAYIPLAKSKRGQSMKILEEVARIFGFGLHNVQMANGGTSDVAKAVTTSTSTSSAPNLTLQINPSQGLSEKQIGEAAMAEFYWRLSNL